MSQVNRRELIRAFAFVAPLGSSATLFQVQARRLRYEEFGSGPVLIVGPPITLSSSEIIRTSYLKGLTDRYRVILMDYPTSDEEASSFTPDRVTEDILAVANAAGADRFAWYGFSWGAVVGLQLAARTNRLTALVCGGWPPLGGPYAATLAASEALAAKVPAGRTMVTYYRALQNWPERQELSKFTVPSMVFAGAQDEIVTLSGDRLRIAGVISKHRTELETLGWTVKLVNGFGHDLVNHPEVVVPLIRAFLDVQLSPPD